MKRHVLYSSAALLFWCSAVGRTAVSSVADLAITTAPSSSSLTQGQQVTFSLMLANLGPSNVTTTISVTNFFSAGLQYVSDTGGSTNGSYDAGARIWSVPGLAAGSTAHLSITASATGVGYQSNIVTIGVPIGFFDPNTTNNTSAAYVNVAPTAQPAAIGMAATATPTNTLVKGQGTFVYIDAYLTNTAPAGSSNLNYTLTFSFPPNPTFTNGSQSSFTNSLTPGNWTTATADFPGSEYPPGSYPVVVTVTDSNASNSPQSRTVNITVLPQPAALIGMSTSVGYTFFNRTNTIVEGQPVFVFLDVSNTAPPGSLNLNYTETVNLPPNAAYPAGHQSSDTNTLAPGASREDSFAFDSTGCPPGSYQITSSVVDPNAGNSPQTNTVLLIVLPGPAVIGLSASPATNVVAQGASVQFYVYVTNTSPTGCSNLNYTITDRFPDGSIAQATNTLAPGGVQSWPVTFDSTQLLPGQYQVVTTVTDPNAHNSPKSVQTTFFVIGKAVIGMSAVVPRATAIQGGQVPFYVYVTNSAPAGSSNLNYTLTQVFPNASQVSVSGTLGPQAWTVWTNTFDTTPYPPSSPPGYVYALRSTVSDANAANNPQSATNYISIDAHARPYLYFQGSYFDLTEAPTLAVEPTTTPEAFGATGGGEFFPAASPSVIGDPVEAAADLDLDTVANVGSPYITTDLASFADLPPDYDLTATPASTNSHPFTIYLSHAAPPGLYTNTFYLGFSDEQDLPGADAPGSVPGSFTLITTVPPPSLGIGRTNNDLLVAWFTNVMPFNLQRSSDLATWTAVTNPPSVVGFQYQISIPAVEASSFFRLISGP